MGILDRFRGNGEKATEAANPARDPAIAAQIEKTQREIQKTLNPGADLVPEGIDIKLQPWETPADIRAVATEIQESFEGNVNNPHSRYTMAVMPPEYDSDYVKGAEFAGDPDKIWTGDGFIRKRTKEIVSCKIGVEDYSQGDWGNNPQHEYYQRDRYFVTVNGGKVLPRASVYRFANGQVQTLLCKYNTEARPEHYEEVVDGKITNTVDNTFYPNGNIRTTTEYNFDGNGKLIGRYEAQVTHTPGDVEPWKMDAQWFKLDARTGQLVPEGKRSARGREYKDLHVYSDLKVKNLAMPNPVDPKATIGRPGYPV